MVADSSPCPETLAMTRHSLSLSRSVEATEACATAQVLDELQLYGHHLHDDDPDPSPLPEASALKATAKSGPWSLSA